MRLTVIQQPGESDELRSLVRVLAVRQPHLDGLTCRVLLAWIVEGADRDIDSASGFVDVFDQDVVRVAGPVLTGDVDAACESAVDEVGTAKVVAREFVGSLRLGGYPAMGFGSRPWN